MTDKAYIVTNEQQESEVLEKLKREGLVWGFNEGQREFVPSKWYVGVFPYVVSVGARMNFSMLSEVEDEEIVFDGRKEEHMSEKYVVSQEFMKELEEWKQQGNTEAYFVGWYDISVLPDDVKRWWTYPEINNFENNNRLIAIIRWVNGEDVFEIEKSKKLVVRSKNVDSDGETAYVDLVDNVHAYVTNSLFIATRFDTKEEAESWANSHQEVVEVVDV